MCFGLWRSKNKMSCVHRDLKPANLMLGGIPHDSTGAPLGLRGSGLAAQDSPCVHH